MLKSKSEIREELLNNLASKTGVNITEDGSIAVAMVDTLLDEIYSLYYQLDVMKSEAYLSTSNGEYTELIAELVNTSRDGSETDDDLKIRTGNSVFRHAKGNRIAIEEAALSVTGVANVDYRPYGLGTGSFVIYVYPQSGSNTVRILDRVQEVLNGVVAEGIYFEVRQPEEKPIDVAVVLQFDSLISVMEKQTVRGMVKNKIVQYLNNLKKDDVLYINELIQLAMETDTHILDMSIMELKVDGFSKTISNTFPANDARFISGTISVI